MPTRYQLRTGPFIIFSNMPIAAESAPIRCLQVARERPRRQAGLPRPCRRGSGRDLRPRRPQRVRPFPQVLLSRAAAAPSLLPGPGAARVVYTYSSPRLEEDLRHEATHALLRGGYGDLPLWLDEGLAEYFETPADTPDAQHEHLVKIADDLKQAGRPTSPAWSRSPTFTR